MLPKDAEFPLASMRPPQFAGEDSRAAYGHRTSGDASMRPPQFAGEDGELEATVEALEAASMRPPQFAGEDAACWRIASARGARFNEAPAVRGGRCG